MEPSEGLFDQIKEGVEHCRSGRWDVGLPILERASEAKRGSFELPGVLYSFLGYGLASRERRISEGLKLCEHAVKIEFYNPENFWNLARTHLLAGNRRQGISAIARGLRVDKGNKDLLRLLVEAGVRRRPVVPFLQRHHPVNYLLGRARHAVLGPPSEVPSQKTD